MMCEFQNNLMDAWVIGYAFRFDRRVISDISEESVKTEFPVY
jgi:hypothetical protein